MNKLFLKFRCRFSLKEQTHFAKRLAFLTGAGVTLLESLILLRRQNKSKAKDEVYEKIVKDVSNGQFLSTSLKKFHFIFGDFAVNVIRAGESSGILSQNLSYLAEELKKKNELKRKIQSALIYPIFISLATLGITIVLTAYIFPKLLPIFQSIHVALPFSTRILIFLSNLLREYGIFMFLGIVIVGIGLFLIFEKSSAFSFFIHKMILRMPIVKRIIVSFNMANFCRTLGLLLKSGISIADALLITAETSGNPVYKKEFRQLAKKISEGGRISVSLSGMNIFPDLSLQMIGVGETSGNLGDILLYLAELHESEVEEETRNLTNSVEPVLMILMGLVVGFVAISIITPIYGVTQNLGR